MKGIVIAWRRLRIWFSSHRIELRLSLRVAASAVLALLLAQFFHLRFEIWAVLTAVLLTQMSVGKSVKATGDYLMGTLSGAVFAGAIGALIPHESALALAFVLAITLVPVALIAAENSRFGAAPFTAVLVLLAPTIIHIGPVSSALERLFEVGVGGLVGLVVSFVVLPAHASELSVEAANRVLHMMAQELPKLVREFTRDKEEAALLLISDKIAEAYASAQTSAGEGAHERMRYFGTAPDLGPLLRCLLALQHDFIMIRRTAPLPAIAQAQLAPALVAVGEAAAASLREYGLALASRRRVRLLGSADAAFDRYAAAVTALDRGDATRDLPLAAHERIYALAFALEELRRDLRALEDCVNVFAGSRATDPQAGPERKLPA